MNKDHEVQTHGASVSLTQEVNPNSLYDKLDEIEHSTHSDYVLSMDLADFCELFAAPSALLLLTSE